MYRRIESFRNTFGFFMLFLIVMCVSSWGDSKANGSQSFKLSRGAYSPDANSFLFIIRIDLDKQKFGDFAEIMKNENINILAIFDEEKGVAKHLFYPVNTITFDFAWAPGKTLYVTTHSDRMTLFQKNADGGYSGMAIRCPVDFMYTFCSWNPKGDWLAVNCRSTNPDKPSDAFRLGLYELKKEKFVISDIMIDSRPLIWKDDSTLYAKNNDNVLEVRLESGTPRLVQTIPIEKGVTQFYGMFDDQALVLVWKKKQIKLGNKTLIELDRSGVYKVVTTPTAIFVSASPTNLVVFDHKGRKINTTNPGRTIKFGPIGKDPNTVYGLAGSILLRVSLEKGNLNIEEVVDLFDDSIYVIPSLSESAK